MPTTRPHAGHVVAALGAILTIAALWMPWYALAFADELGSALRDAAPAPSEPMGAFARGLLEAFGQAMTLDAWTIFKGTDALLAAAGALVLVATVAAASDRVDAEAAARGIAWVGAGALALVAFKLVDQPGPDALLEVRHGAWAAAAGCVLMIAGGLAARVPARRPAAAQDWDPPVAGSVPPPA